MPRESLQKPWPPSLETSSPDRHSSPDGKTLAGLSQPASFEIIPRGVSTGLCRGCVVTGLLCSRECGSTTH